VEWQPPPRSSGSSALCGLVLRWPHRRSGLALPRGLGLKAPAGAAVLIPSHRRCFPFGWGALSVTSPSCVTDLEAYPTPLVRRGDLVSGLSSCSSPGGKREIGPAQCRGRNGASRPGLLAGVFSSIPPWLCCFFVGPGGRAGVRQLQLGNTAGAVSNEVNAQKETNCTTMLGVQGQLGPATAAAPVITCFIRCRRCRRAGLACASLVGPGCGLTGGPVPESGCTFLLGTAIYIPVAAGEGRLDVPVSGTRDPGSGGAALRLGGFCLHACRKLTCNLGRRSRSAANQAFSPAGAQR